MNKYKVIIKRHEETIEAENEEEAINTFLDEMIFNNYTSTTLLSELMEVEEVKKTD